MLNFPALKIELTGVRQSIQHMFSQNDEALSKMISDTLEKTITEEWVQDHIHYEVQVLIEKSISKLHENWDLKNAVRDLVAIEITKIIEK